MFTILFHRRAFFYFFLHNYWFDLCTTQEVIWCRIRFKSFSQQCTYSFVRNRFDFIFCTNTGTFLRESQTQIKYKHWVLCWLYVAYLASFFFFFIKVVLKSFYRLLIFVVAFIFHTLAGIFTLIFFYFSQSRKINEHSEILKFHMLRLFIINYEIFLCLGCL